MKTKHKQKYEEIKDFEPIIINVGVTLQDKIQVIKEYLMFCWDKNINPEWSYSLIMFEEYQIKQ